MIAAVYGIFGLAVGSFLNVVIHRVPAKASLLRPPSSCPSCQTPIRHRDNVPVLSFVLLKGRCSTCRARISPRYPLVELLTAGLFVGAAVRYPDIELAAFVAAACAVFVALAFIDLDTRRVPNVIVLPSTAAAVAWVAVAALVRGELSLLVNSLASGAAGFVLLFVIAVVSGGMGFGDVKLAAFIGVTTGRLGYEAFVLALFGGFVLGGLVAIVLLVTKRRGRKDAIPFAPALCAGAVIGLFAGAEPVRVWLGV